LGYIAIGSQPGVFSETLSQHKQKETDKWSKK
jgi:hypothetical protein